MRISQLTTAWLAAALKEDPFRVSGLEPVPVGTGQVADTYRLSFRLDGAARSLILKLTAEDAVSRETGRRQANYLREVRYYQCLAGSLEVRAPRCWHAAISEDGAEFELLLEDMTPCRPGNQLAGCTVAEVAAVLDEAAKPHGARWQDPSLAEQSWLTRTSPMRRPGVFTAMFAAFRERYGDQMFLSMVRNAGQHALDLDALGLLGLGRAS
jgi:hypothetical protein